MGPWRRSPICPDASPPTSNEDIEAIFGGDDERSKRDMAAYVKQMARILESGKNRKTLEGQNTLVAPEVLAPALKAFFGATS